MKYRSILLFCLLVFGFSAYAHNKVVVIPMAGDDLKPLENIITVAKKNGDFTDPEAALRSIVGVASATNPFLIVIAPGVYPVSEPLNMLQYVDVVGSGKNVTKLTGSFSSSTFNGSSAMVIGNNNATLQDLTIDNINGGELFSIGIYNLNSAPTISNVEVKITGGTGNHFGIVNLNALSTPSITDSEVIVTGGSSQTGIYNSSGSAPIISNLDVSVAGAATSQTGIYTSSSFLTISDSSIRVQGGGGVQAGMQFASTAFVTASNIHISLSGGGGAQYGIRSNNGGGTGLQFSEIDISVQSGGTTQYGIFNTLGSISIAGGEINVFTGSNGNFGVYNSSSSTLNLRNLDISATTVNGFSAYGAFGDSNTGIMNIYSSVLTATTASVVFGGNTNTRIANSVLTDGVQNDPVGVNCGGVYNGSLSIVNC